MAEIPEDGTELGVVVGTDVGVVGKELGFTVGRTVGAVRGKRQKTIQMISSLNSNYRYSVR